MTTAHDILRAALTPEAFERTLRRCAAETYDGGDGVTVDVDAAKDMRKIFTAQALVERGKVRP